METFLFAGQRGDWRAAAHALDLSLLPPSEQARRGPELARQLHEVIGRTMIVDWTDLSDRQDAVEVNTSKDAPLAGAPRRNFRLALVDLSDRTVSIRIARLKPEGGEAQWLFSRQTVENVPAMYERYGPRPFERALPAPLREKAFWTLAWWEVVALPLVLFAALGAGAGTYVLLHRRKGERGGFLGRALHALRWPFALFAFVGTFWILKTSVFVFSVPVNSVLEPLLTLLLALAIGMILLRLFEALLDFIRERRIDDISDPDAEHDRNLYTSLSAARRLFLVILFLLGAAFVLIESGLSQTLGFSLIASAGLIGLILVFAARSALANIMASMQIAFSRIARVGDAVLFEDSWCYVEQIGLSHVRLRTWEGRRLLVPVETFVSEPFENWTKEDPSLLKPVILHLDHRANVAKLREAFEDFVAKDEAIIEKEEATVQVVAHSPRGMELRFLARAPDPSTGWDMHCRLREHMLAVASRLDDAEESGADEAYLPRERDVIIGQGGGAD